MKKDCEQTVFDPLKIHPALKEYFGYSLKMTALRYKHKQEEALEPFGVYPQHMGILRILMMTSSLNQMALGDQLGIDKATMVKLIDHLEKKGFVRRIVDPSDRRGKLIEVTVKGEKKFAEVAIVMRQVSDEFLLPLTKKEKTLLHSMLIKLISRNE